MNSSAATRILHVLHRLDYGGVETWLLDLVRWSDPERLHHSFLVHGAPGALEGPVSKAHGTIVRGQDPHRYFTFTASLKRILAEQGPFQVVHSHLHLYSGIVMRTSARSGIPVRIAHGHSITPDGGSLRRRIYKGLMQRWIRRYATIGLAASEPALLHLFGADRDQRWQVLHCGIDIQRFADAKPDPGLRQQLGIPHGVRLIGHVGRLVMEKNHDFMLRVAVECPEAWFVFIGDGPLRTGLQEKTIALGIDKRVIFAGARSDVPALLKSMDVFLFPSLYEGLGLAMVEAQAAGLPVVHADHLPKDAAVIPELCSALPLTASAKTWAERLMTAHVPAGIALRQRLDGSHFSQATGFARLGSIYQEGR